MVKDRDAGCAAVLGVMKTWTGLGNRRSTTAKDLSKHFTEEDTHMAQKSQKVLLFSKCKLKP